MHDSLTSDKTLYVNSFPVASAPCFPRPAGPSKTLVRFCDNGVRYRDGRIRLKVVAIAEELQ